MNTPRHQRLQRALFRGDALTFENPEYRHAANHLMEALLEADGASDDLTSEALGFEGRAGRAEILAREPGIVAGLQEVGALLQGSGLNVSVCRRDGDSIQPGDVLLHTEGDDSRLLSFERLGLNLLQRMSGVATASNSLQARARQHGSAYVVGTRKTPWGLLDKRALHVGGCGTHRLGLSDAILIKNNHLALIAATEQEAAPIAIERVWESRAQSAFIEVEVRSEDAARSAAHAFRKLRVASSDDYPCLLMLDNVPPQAVAGIVKMLQRESLWDDTLIEASGGVSEASVGVYASTGVDAVSMGALTHSVRALDISQRLS